MSSHNVEGREGQSLPGPHSYHSRLQSLITQFSYTRKRTEELCLPLEVEDFMTSVTEDTSPIKWHLAHTTWFFEFFLLKRFMPNFRAFHSTYHFLFNSYYKAAGDYLPKNKRRFLSRPSTENIFEYRTHVGLLVFSLSREIREGDLPLFLEILELGIHHEQQHQELMLMDIKRNFFENPLKPDYHDQTYGSSSIESIPEWVMMPAEVVSIGVESRSEAFAFDNEKDKHLYWCEKFFLQSHLVTNGDFLEFIEDGGYNRPLLWASDGWDYKEKEQWKHPLYWEHKDQSWWHMTFSGMIPIDWHAPVVHVSYYEASAYAKWKSARLPTEYEWEVAAGLEKSKGQFFDTGIFQPEVPDNSHEHFSQIHGTVWEWTQSSYLPYPRYQATGYGLAEYNEKFMCNQMVLRGGSCVTPSSHYRTTYRNYYYPYMRWQFAGIRLAKDVII